MSHITGEYTFNLGAVKHYWNSPLKTGVSRLEIELNANFDGTNEDGVAIHESHKAFGVKRFENPIPQDYLTDNLNDICNTFLVDNGFYEICESIINTKIHGVPQAITEEPLEPEITVPDSFTGIKNL